MTEEKMDGEAASPRVVLLRINEMYRLHEGTEYLKALLMGQGGYPTPVICINFKDSFEMTLFLNRHPVTDFWGINPDIVDRLRRCEELIDVEPPGP